MGKTYIQARIFGENETREYAFFVDTGATHMGLPLEDIEALGLRRVRGSIRLMTANGIIEAPRYLAEGELMGDEFGMILVPTPVPLIGYELLEDLRYRVNPVTRSIERVPDDVPHPPYLL